MKYMGSKRSMLRNGLGELLQNEISNFDRFIDLFTGSGVVANHVAINYPIPVYAYDIQAYSVAATSAVIARDVELDGLRIWKEWFTSANEQFAKLKCPTRDVSSRKDVEWIRDWCADQVYPITRAYGGHYFSASQALWFDVLRATVPQNNESKTAAIAALIEAASLCVAAPGHTAQPFQPTETAIRFLIESWSRDPLFYTNKALIELAQQKALAPGLARIADANLVAKELKANDLVFIDPPYSGVHYSRFYHVLETVAVGECGEVSGVGRYPAASRRPRSNYSLKGQSSRALSDLLQTISSVGASAILTFPDHACSNGLTGEQVRNMANAYFHVEDRYIETVFSTLGGHSLKLEPNKSRHARQPAKEMMLFLSST
ncbi:adenine methyltransferase [Brucella anthropi]|uniref:DNA adenine methylase n=1 Tax=Brucella anthropi TaxID=529 RepID=UPI00124D91D9|nr:DNA adenine methylase [Brucella anthropi]KAB2757672.1 adenine methyltransferase [Brucella anthropi]